ncbi:hypothetical protein [Pseudomonas sp. TTU2014-080ASC]|uniref:hypothetical protein n=1 Tax=Pseudomonas sp. TTU2014-080ASC TaxID=1729724 RepID=UPI0007185280|nr:hypothetical protein [Pseudomonas sp. TTU2014-080ASC]KRW62347.1 hypothetical protein AO726_02685 [Pseudomonas sp. TTU2014-080ASC]
MDEHAPPVLELLLKEQRRTNQLLIALLTTLSEEQELVDIPDQLVTPEVHEACAVKADVS